MVYLPHSTHFVNGLIANSKLLMERILKISSQLFVAVHSCTASWELQTGICNGCVYSCRLAHGVGVKLLA